LDAVVGFELSVRRAFTSLCGVLALAGCGEESPPVPDAVPEWTLVHDDLESALISVWGTSAEDVWAVGADSGAGPLVLHWDGASWTALDSGVRADFYWAFGFEAGPVFLGGTNGTIVRYEAGVFERMQTPGNGTVFGIWGASPDALWAVGGAEGGSSGGFAWQIDGDAWVEADGFPDDVAGSKAIWKVWGSAADDVWLVGTAGSALHFDGAAFSSENLGSGESLFTVHYAGGRFAAVGGFATGLLFENAGTGWSAEDASDFPGLVGVALTERGGYAVGSFGTFIERADGVWREAKGPPTIETLHAIWVDPDGGLWSVGGQVQARPLVRGLLAYRGPAGASAASEP
jgi:hypothetical protein